MVKVKISEGLVARLLIVGIVCIVPRNKLIDQGLLYKIASVREGSRVGPLAALARVPRLAKPGCWAESLPPTLFVF